MGSRYRWLAGGVALLAVLAPGGAAALDAVMIVEVHGETAVYPRDAGPKIFFPGVQREQHHAGGITFTIAYDDVDTGFQDPAFGASARQLLRDTLTYVAGVLDYASGEMDIQVRQSEFDGAGPLASAGATFHFAPGIQSPATLHRLNTGEKLFPGFPEMTLMVDFGWNYFFTGEGPNDSEIDFATVLLHEITHGIGFISLIGYNGHSAGGLAAYSIFDALLTDRSGSPLLSLDGLFPVFQANPRLLSTFGVAFNGLNAVAVSGDGLPVPVNAPPRFSGSSLSHWSFGRVEGGTVMEPSLLPGVVRREYTPQDLAAVIDLKNYSRGDGRAGDGPRGCRPQAPGAAESSSRGDVVLFGVVLFSLMAGRAVTSVKS